MAKKSNPFLRGFSLKGAKAAAPADAAKGTKGTKGTKPRAGGMKLKAGRHGHGVVKHIEQGKRYGDNIEPASHARVTVHHGPTRTPKGKGSGLGGDIENRESTVHVNAADAKHLSVGDKVRIHLEKLGA